MGEKKAREICADCGHGYGSHYGYRLKSPCHHGMCNCRDFSPLDEFEPQNIRTSGFMPNAEFRALLTDYDALKHRLDVCEAALKEHEDWIAERIARVHKDSRKGGYMAAMETALSHVQKVARKALAESKKEAP